MLLPDFFSLSKEISIEIGSQLILMLTLLSHETSQSRPRDVSLGSIASRDSFLFCHTTSLFRRDVNVSDEEKFVSLSGTSSSKLIVLFFPVLDLITALCGADVVAGDDREISFWKFLLETKTLSLK